LYHCKKCNRGGNPQQFVTWWYEKYLRQTRDDDYRRLKDLRGGISLQTLKRHGLAYAGERHGEAYGGEWIIPFKSAAGKIANLQLYSEKNGRKLNLPGFRTCLYGLDRLSNDPKKIVFLCEGPFDCIALDFHLGLKRGKYDIVGSPGPFKAEWAPIFQGRKVRALFDNDRGGESHSQTVRRLLGESRIASELRILKWPSGFPEGYDINDLVRDHPEISIVGWALENSCKVVTEPTLIVRHGRANKEPKAIEWIWPDHLRCGSYVSFSGKMASLKTTVAVDIAARHTRGERMPLCNTDGLPAGHVLYIHAEDDAEAIDDLFETAGGDFQRWHTMPAVIRSGDALNVLDHLGEIEQVIREYGIRLVIIDGQNSVVGGPDIRTDMRGRANVTNKLHQFAQRTNVCLIGIRNEDVTGRALGCQSMSDLGRCVLRAVEEETKVRDRFFRLVFVKVSDASPKNYPPIPYSVEDLGGSRRRILWGKSVGKSLVKGPEGKKGREENHPPKIIPLPLHST
jgi:hypothetical protein